MKRAIACLLLVSLAAADQVITDIETVECTVVAADNEHIYAWVEEAGEKRFPVEEVRRVLITDRSRLAYLRGQLAGSKIPVEYYPGPTKETGLGDSDSAGQTRHPKGCFHNCLTGWTRSRIGCCGGGCLGGAILGLCVVGLAVSADEQKPEEEIPMAIVGGAIVAGAGALLGGIVGALVADMFWRKNYSESRLLPPSFALRPVQTEGDSATLSADVRLVNLRF